MRSGAAPIDRLKLTAVARATGTFGRRDRRLLRLLLASLGVSVLILATAYRVHSTGGFLFDFKGDLYDAGRAILHGRNPYEPHHLAALAAAARAGRWISHTFAVPLYPAPMLVTAVPFALIPPLPSGLLFLGLMVAAMVYGLRLLGVRDWRCLVVALGSWPFVFGLDLGALGPVLVLGAGVAWRHRDRVFAPAFAIAAIVIAKLFPATLLAWLLLTKRFRTFAAALVIGGVLTAAAWAVLGFAGLADYPQMMTNLSYVERGAGASLVTALMATGLSGGIAQAAALAVAAMIIMFAYVRVGRPGGDAQAFGLAVIAALIASPIVWPHYFVLLFVPIALISPRLTPLWLVPLPLVFVGTPTGEGLLLQLDPWLLVLAVVAVVLCRQGDGSRVAEPESLPDPVGPAPAQVLSPIA